MAQRTKDIWSWNNAFLPLTASGNVSFRLRINAKFDFLHALLIILLNSFHWHAKRVYLGEMPKSKVHIIFPIFVNSFIKVDDCYSLTCSSKRVPHDKRFCLSGKKVISCSIILREKGLGLLRGEKGKSFRRTKYWWMINITNQQSCWLCFPSGFRDATKLLSPTLHITATCPLELWNTGEKSWLVKEN